MIPVVETKSSSHDVAGAFEDFARAFEAFKDTNDTRLGEIETRLSGDVVTDEKLIRIDAALDDAKKRLDRFALDRSRPPLASPETRRAIRRRPNTRPPSAPICVPARRPASSGSRKRRSRRAPGLMAATWCRTTVEREVLQRLAAVSPIRAISSVRVISGGQYKRAFSITGPASGWVGETAARPRDRRIETLRDELSGDGTLRHAGRHPDPPRRQHRGYRPLDRRRGRVGLRRAGERRLYSRRRRQQAQGLFVRPDRSRTRSGNGAVSVQSRPAARPFRPPIPPTSWWN